MYVTLTRKQRNRRLSDLFCLTYIHKWIYDFKTHYNFWYCISFWHKRFPYQGPCVLIALPFACHLFWTSTTIKVTQIFVGQLLPVIIQKQCFQIKFLNSRVFLASPLQLLAYTSASTLATGTLIAQLTLTLSNACRTGFVMLRENQDKKEQCLVELE